MTPQTSDEMQQYWDTSAAKNAYGSVMTARKDWSKDEYYQEGKKHVEELVVPFLNKKGITNTSAMTIVDLGCGTGRMSRFLRDRFNTVIGTDVSKEMIETAKRDHSDTDISFFATSGVDLAPIQSESVDVVFSFATLQHVSSKTAVIQNLKECFRVLKTGGHLKIEVRGEPGNPAGRVLWFKGFNHFYIALVLWRNLIPAPFFRRYTPLYGACFQPQELASILKSIGFQSVETYRVGGRHLWAEAIA